MGRERTADATILRFTADPDVEERISDLIAREAACCPFLDYSLIEESGVLTWTIWGAAGPAQATLDGFWRLLEWFAAGPVSGQ